jgi:serine/threonine protein phosphatase 1
MRRFTIGDIHGAYKALKHVLRASNFNYQEDTLICLGDVADGWPEVPQCFEELLKIKHLVYIIGNHCEWLYQYLRFGSAPEIWTMQGGMASLLAYTKIINKKGRDMADRHAELLKNALSYYVTEDNKLFVHGGFNWHQDISTQPRHDLVWDRNLFVSAVMWHEKKTGDRVKDYDEVFIGHTTTSRYRPDLTPVHVSNVWCLDQGAGWEGKLTLLDIDSKEYFQSPLVYTLYPNIKGRR